VFVEERREGAHLLNLDGALDEIGKDMCILRHPKTDSYSLMMDARRVSDMLMSRSLWNNASLDTVSNASALSSKDVISHVRLSCSLEEGIEGFYNIFGVRWCMMPSLQLTPAFHSE